MHLTNNAIAKQAKNSSILWIGMMAANVSNYLFHLLMGRFLGPENYGVLASLISVYYIVMIPTGTIAIIVAKFSAEFNVEKAYSKVSNLLRYLTKRLLLFSFALFIVFILLSGLISNFLNIKSAVPIVLLSFSFPVGYTISINRGVLHGLQKFPQLSLNHSLEAFTKLIIGFVLIYIGFAVNGAIIGIASGVLIAYILSFAPLRFLFEQQKSDEKSGKIAQYALPVFIAYMCLTGYYSLDIILVKHFLSEAQAGLYSGLAILGKIVVFTSLAIVGAMFPVVAGLSKQQEKHEEAKYYLRNALLLVTVISGAVVLVYFTAPSLVISILFGTKYLSIAPYLGLFGVAMLLLALAGVLIYYYLAIYKTSFVYFLIAVVFLQIALIVMFHDTIKQIVLVMLAAMLILIISLIVYYFLAIDSVEQESN